MDHSSTVWNAAECPVPTSEDYLQIRVPESAESKVMKFVEIMIKRKFEETGNVQPKEEELS